jgi:hypothetical protein
LQGAGFGEEPVVRDDVGVFEDDGEFFAGFGQKLLLDELQAQRGFDDDFASAFAFGPGVGFGGFRCFEADLRGVIRFGDLRVAGEVGEGLRQSMRGEEDVVAGAHAEVNLARGDDLRDFEEERLAAVELLHAADFERIVAGCVGILHRILRRAVLRAVAVVPALREAP